LTVCGFGLRVAPLPERPFRLLHSGAALVLECERSEGWRSVSIAPTNDELLSDLGKLRAALADCASVELGPSERSWRIETAAYRVPLPAGWTLHATGEQSASPLFELHGADDASLSVRTSRRMPSIEAFQGTDHVFRDIGQLERGGFIEFEHAEASRTWLYRHEQFHRGTTPYAVTLKAPVEQAHAYLPTLALLVEQLELPTGTR
jgi:hypothetical protein